MTASEPNDPGGEMMTALHALAAVLDALGLPYYVGGLDRQLDSWGDACHS